MLLAHLCWRVSAGAVLLARFCWRVSAGAFLSACFCRHISAVVLFAGAFLLELFCSSVFAGAFLLEHCCWSVVAGALARVCKRASAIVFAVVCFAIVFAVVSVCFRCSAGAFVLVRFFLLAPLCCRFSAGVILWRVSGGVLLDVFAGAFLVAGAPSRLRSFFCSVAFFVCGAMLLARFRLCVFVSRSVSRWISRWISGWR